MVNATSKARSFMGEAVSAGASSGRDNGCLEGRVKCCTKRLQMLFWGEKRRSGFRKQTNLRSFVYLI